MGHSFSYDYFVVEAAASYAVRALGGYSGAFLELPVHTGGRPTDKPLEIYSEAQYMVYYLTCLHVACKWLDRLQFSETLSTSIAQSCSITFAKSDIIELELRLLEAVGWRLWEIGGV